MKSWILEKNDKGLKKWIIFDIIMRKTNEKLLDVAMNKPELNIQLNGYLHIYLFNIQE